MGLKLCLMHMRVRVGLTANETEKVVEFLQSAN